MPFQDVYDSAEVAEEAPRPYYGIKFEGSGGGGIPRALKFVASKEEMDADQGCQSDTNNGKDLRSLQGY